jgi:hypothetical protein
MKKLFASYSQNNSHIHFFYFFRCKVFHNAYCCVMEIENKLQELIREGEESLAALSLKQQCLKARISGFKDSLAAINGTADESFRQKIEDKIRKDTAAAEEVSNKAFEITARLTAFQESLKLLSKNGTDGKPKDLRPESELAKVRDIIRAAGKPLSLTEILSTLGKANDKKKLISLRGTLRGYANRGQVFLKGDTSDSFGLIEFEKLSIPPRRVAGTTAVVELEEGAGE